MLLTYSDIADVVQTLRSCETKKHQTCADGTHLTAGPFRSFPDTPWCRRSARPDDTICVPVSSCLPADASSLASSHPEHELGLGSFGLEGRWEVLGHRLAPSRHQPSMVLEVVCVLYTRSSTDDSPVLDDQLCAGVGESGHSDTMGAKLGEELSACWLMLDSLVLLIAVPGHR